MASSLMSSLFAASAAVPHEERLELTAEPSVETVLTAVRILHDPASSQEERSYASKFLTAIQSSPCAWLLADQLLIAKEYVDIQSTYFAAQTIRYKIQTCFASELQVQQHESLRESLINHLNQIAASPQVGQQEIRVIINQLSLSLAYLTILDASWSDPLGSLMKQVKDPMVQLQILTYVPEEVVECNSASSNNEDVRDARLRGVGSNRRRQVIRYLGQVSHSMIQHLTQTAKELTAITGSSESGQNHREKAMIFRAFASWIHVLFTGHEFSTSGDMAGQKGMTTDQKIVDVRNKLELCCPIFFILITSLSDTKAEDDEHDSSADALTAFLSCFFHSDPVQDLACDIMSGTTSVSKLSEEQTQLLSACCGIVHGILNLDAAFISATDAEEIDKSVNIIRVFAECADASLDLLIALVATSCIGDSLIQVNPLNVKPDNEPEACKSVLMSVVLRILEFVQSHYDVDVAETSFNFFHKFSDSIYSLIYKNNAPFGSGQAPPHHYTDAPSKISVMTSNSSSILSNSEVKARVQEFGLHVTESLIKGLRKYSQLEPDEESVLPTESEFRDFRGRVRELLRDVVFMIGAGSLVSHLTIQFMTPGNCWEEVEADLFFVSCLVHELLDRDGISLHDEIIIRVIENVMNATVVRDPAGRVASLKQGLHGQILATCCDIFADLAMWLKLKTFFLRDVLCFLFHVIVSSKKIPDLMIAATGALEPIIESCFAPVEESLDRRIPDPNLAAEDLLGSDDSPALISICSELDSLSNEDAAHHLLQSAANLVSSLGSNVGSVPPDQIRSRQEELMCKLLHPHLLRLQSHLTASADPTQDLDRITALFRPLRLVPLTIPTSVNLPLDHKIQNEVWPLIESVLRMFSTKSDRIIERACRTLRYILRSVRPVLLIVPVAVVIGTLFNETSARHSCFLYVLSILVDEFVPSSQTTGSAATSSISAEDGEKIADGMLDLLQAVSNTTFQFFTGTRIRDHPDTIDDFFRLCARYIQKRPEKFAASQILLYSQISKINVLELALLSLDIDQREANHSVTRFLTEFFESLQDKNSQLPTCPPTTPSPFSQSSSGVGSSSSPMSSPANDVTCMEKARRLVVSEYAARLTDRVLGSCLFSLPSYFLPDFADVVFALMQLDREKAFEWFKAFFSGTGLASKLADAVAASGAEQAASMQQQLQTGFDSLMSARHAKTVTQTLRSMHRLFRNR